MTAGLSVADINTYLAVNDWTRRPENWRGAAIWVHEGGHEIVVPGSDHLGDTPRRVREIVALLARLEGRSPEEIAADIDAPMTDVQWYRTPIVPTSGHLGLVDAVTAFTSAKAVLSAAARTALHGPRAAFEGVAPKAVRQLLARTSIGPIVPSGDTLTLRLPLERDSSGEPPLARRTLLLLDRASPLLRDATAETRRTGDIGVFDGTVRYGVSADLCDALARFAGPDPGASFEIGFRWGRALPAEAPARSVVFEPGAGPLLRRVSHRLRRLHREHAGTATDDRSEEI